MKYWMSTKFKALIKMAKHRWIIERDSSTIQATTAPCFCGCRP